MTVYISPNPGKAMAYGISQRAAQILLTHGAQVLMQDGLQAECMTMGVEYLTQKRMETARRLLQQSDQRSCDIANAVGYKDPHYFSYLFKKTQGCTPRNYRGGGKNETVNPEKKR